MFPILELKIHKLSHVPGLIILLSAVRMRRVRPERLEGEEDDMRRMVEDDLGPEEPPHEMQPLGKVFRLVNYSFSPSKDTCTLLSRVSVFEAITR